MKVAVVGLGQLGLPVAAGLAGQGAAVLAFDVDAARVAQAVAHGACAATRGQALQSALVVTLLPDDTSLSALCLGEEGLLACLPPGGVHLCMGTIGTALAQTLADAHAAAGQGFVACPVFGRPEEAWARDLTAVFGAAQGGPPQALVGARRLVAGLAPRLHDVPSPVAACAVKLAGNQMMASAIVTQAECFGLAAGHGVPPAQLQAIVTGKLFRGPMYEGVGRMLAGAVPPAAEPAFTLRLGLKDLMLADDAARALHWSMPVADAVRERLARAVADGHGARDWAELTACDSPEPTSTPEPAMNLFDPALYDQLRLPLDQARGLPAACYTDPAFHEREFERIFAAGWVMVGRADRAAQPGDWFTAEFGRARIIVTHDDTGTLRAFGNACSHRGTPLVEGQGHCRTLVCPYHAWTFGLDGQLLGAPGMKEALGFDPADHPLKSVRLDTWGGFVFVCLSPTAPGLAEWLGDLPQRLAMYGLEHMRLARRVEYDLACNWKVWVENFMEGYHIPTVHRSTISRQKAVNIPEDPGRGEYTAIYERHEGTRALLHGDTGFPPIDTLTGDSSEGSRFILVYPATMLAIANDTMWCFEAHPLGPLRTRIVLSSCFPAQHFGRDDFAEVAARYFKRQDIVVQEDNDISELQQRGLSSMFAAPGRFSVKEKIVHALDNWVVDRVLGDRHHVIPLQQGGAA